MESTFAAIPLDGLRAGLALILLGGLAYHHGDPETRERVWKSAFGFGLVLFALDALAHGLATGVSPGLLIELAPPLLTNILLIGLFGRVLVSLRLISTDYLYLFLALGVLIPTQPTGAGLPPLAPSPPTNMFAPSLIAAMGLVFALEIVSRGTVGAPPHKDIPPLAAAVGKRVPVEDLHTEHSGFILYREGEPTITGVGIDRIGEYIHWRNATADIPNVASLADIESEFYLDAYAADSDSLEKGSAEYEHLQDWLPWVAAQEEVWITDGPPLDQLTLLGTLIALIIGNPLLFLPV